jgi:hypothetical protein
MRRRSEVQHQSVPLPPEGTQQQSVPQLHSGSVPLIQPRITPAAHPTPAFTVTAAWGQFCAQAPHSMQAPSSTMTDVRPSISKTACGHTSTHVPHPVHFSGSSLTVATSSMYLKPFMCLSVPFVPFVIRLDSNGAGGDRLAMPGTVPVGQATKRTTNWAISSNPATPTAPSCQGRERRISTSTPESDVNGVEPVKFMPR